MASEFLAEAQFGGRDYVLRAAPKGMPRGTVSFSLWVTLMVHGWRRIKRERAWVVRVRVRDEDPLGKVIYEEELSDWRAASERLDELADEMRSGKLP